MHPALQTNLKFQALLNRTEGIPGLDPSDLVSRSLALLTRNGLFLLLVCAKKVHWEPKSIADICCVRCLMMSVGPFKYDIQWERGKGVGQNQMRARISCLGGTVTRGKKNILQMSNVN